MHQGRLRMNVLTDLLKSGLIIKEGTKELIVKDTRKVDSTVLIKLTQHLFNLGWFAVPAFRIGKFTRKWVK